MEQLSLNMCFGATRRPSVKAGYNKAFLAAALATENEMKRAGEHPPAIATTSAHTDGNILNSTIAKHEGQGQVHRI